MSKNRRLFLFPTAAAVIIQLSREAHPHETGGILVGRKTNGGMVVRYAVGPGPGAHHGPGSFTRDGQHAQAELDGLYKLSHGEDDYAGEWHSHPLLHGPSPCDQASLAWISRNAAYDQRHPILLICQVNEQDGWSILGYRWARKRLSRLDIDICSACGDSQTR